jgi:hypothetical protein
MGAVRKWGAPPPPEGVRPYRYIDKNSRDIARLSDHFRSPREMAQEAKNNAAAEAEALERAKTLAAKYRRLGTDRRNSAMRELMDRADKALRDRTPEQVEDDRRWGEALHKSFEDIHGYSLQDVPHDPKWLARITNGTDRQPLTTEDLEAYAEPHAYDYDGGAVHWDDQEAGL